MTLRLWAALVAFRVVVDRRVAVPAVPAAAVPAAAVLEVSLRRYLAMTERAAFGH